jgi:hypothetical protein
MKNVKSWAVIDENGDEYISAATVLFEAAGDVSRAKYAAKRLAKWFGDEVNGKSTFTIAKRDVGLYPRKGE